MPHRSFQPIDASTLEGPTFDIGAVPLRCVPYKIAGVLEDLPMVAQLDDLIAFVRGCLVEEDVPAFNAAIHDKNQIVRDTMVVEIYEWLAEAYSDFTPGPSTPSERGLPGTVPMSEAGSGSVESTPTAATLQPTAP